MVILKRNLKQITRIDDNDFFDNNVNFKFWKYINMSFLNKNSQV